ncbi:unnamed protein product [Pleuronectes platessa]|uniref:Uncharacterized protein n=1 Tax=Pleuronectes platessa TaxID=8262 RepID=A0A9N7VF26_PLEPL|nr:unnamed protein product [Pleuronectes platessa]
MSVSAGNGGEERAAPETSSNRHIGDREAAGTDERARQERKTKDRAESRGDRETIAPGRDNPSEHPLLTIRGNSPYDPHVGCLPSFSSNYRQRPNRRRFKEQGHVDKPDGNSTFTLQSLS